MQKKTEKEDKKDKLKKLIDTKKTKALLEEIIVPSLEILEQEKAGFTV